MVIDLLGHGHVRTTMDVYSRVMPTPARAADDRTSSGCCRSEEQVQPTSELHRDPRDLGADLLREEAFPDGVVLSKGTSLEIVAAAGDIPG